MLRHLERHRLKTTMIPLLRLTLLTTPLRSLLRTRTILRRHSNTPQRDRTDAAVDVDDLEPTPQPTPTTAPRDEQISTPHRAAKANTPPQDAPTPQKRLRILNPPPDRTTPTAPATLCRMVASGLTPRHVGQLLVKLFATCAPVYPGGGARRCGHVRSVRASHDGSRVWHGGQLDGQPSKPANTRYDRN